ncbi:MAG: aldehyde dehydrogenase family protein, partial [Peptococcaceae bacterium]|nr:aldehyde dehydrogenase family protein [Peptococcaceae bacterium]
MARGQKILCTAGQKSIPMFKHVKHRLLITTIDHLGEFITCAAEAEANTHICLDILDKSQSAFGFQGQKCSAGSRAIVHQDVVLQLVLDRVRKLKVGQAEKNYLIGPVIDAIAQQKILNYINGGKTEGKLEIGG